MDNIKTISRVTVSAAVVAVVSAVCLAGEIEEGCAAYHDGDRVTARRIWEPLAKQSDPRAQFGMAMLAEEQEQFDHWVARAAAQGHAEACYLMYRASWGTADTRDAKKAALAWLAKSAENGYTEAAAEIGSMLAGSYPHSDVPIDCSRGVRFLEMAADWGHAESAYQLLLLYRNGNCVESSDELVVKWARRGAELGQPMAALNLSGLYHEGRGVPKDDFQAILWFAVWERDLDMDSLPPSVSISPEDFDRALTQAAKIRERYERRPPPRCP